MKRALVSFLILATVLIAGCVKESGEAMSNLYITDRLHWRVVILDTDFNYVDEFSLGADRPHEIAVDGSHIYLRNLTQSRIEKRNKTSPYAMVDSVGYYPYYMDDDEEYLYFSDAVGDVTKYVYIVKKLDLSFVSKFQTSWGGVTSGVAVDVNFIYTSCDGEGKLKKWNKSTHSLVKEVVASSPNALAVDDNYVYVIGWNHDVDIFNKSDLSFVKTIDLGWPNYTDHHIAVEGDYAFVTRPSQDDVKKVKLSTETVVATYSTGLDYPVGIAIAAVPSIPPTAPTELLCNGQANPADIIPSYFSAIYNDPNSGDVAKYFRIQVNMNSLFTGRMLWDSKKTAMSDVNEGERCGDITYNGQSLSLNKIKYYWRIKFWDADDNEGVWSYIAVGEAGGPAGTLFDFTLAGSGAGEAGAGPWGEHLLYAISTAPWNGAFGRAAVEIPRRSGEWTSLADLMRIHTSVNKNPLDLIQIAQAELLFSNIDKDFNSFEEAGAWYKTLEGYAIQITVGCMVSGSPVSRTLFTGIIKSVEADRITQTAEMKVADFLDYFGRVTIEETPIWENISLTTLYKNLVELAFSEWVEGVDYFVEDLGDITIPAIGYENLNLLSELKKIAECRAMRLYTDVNGKLVCRSRAVEGEPWDIKHNYNLEGVKEKRHIDDVINWVIVHARPHEIAYEPTTETPETIVPYVPSVIPYEPPQVLGPDITPPGKISGFRATPGDHRIDLTWSNPLDADFEAVYIRYHTSGFPTHPTSPIALYAGDSESYAHTGLTNGIRYYYSAFTKDITGNWSGAAHALAIPGGVDVGEDTEDTSPVSAFRAEPASGKVTLTWRNPQTANFSEVMIRSSAISYPTGPDKKNKVYEGSAETCQHTGLTNGQRYYYSAFAKNTAGTWSGAQFASAISAGPRKVLGIRTLSGGGCLRSQEGIPSGWTAYAGCFYAGTDGRYKKELSFAAGGRSEGWLRFRHKWEVKVTLPYFKIKREVGLSDDLSLSFSHSLGGLARVTITKISVGTSRLYVEYKLVYTGPRGIRWDFRNELMLRG